MIATTLRKILALTLCCVLSVFSWQIAYGRQAELDNSHTQALEPAETGNPAMHPAPKTGPELQALVAPIALYPDALVAQVLAASTFPDQVAAAEHWLQQHKDWKGKKLEKEANKQDWDESVKALTQFASVLGNMASNLAWTSELGEAYHYQPKDVMFAVQTLRAKAKADGKLESNQQIKVVQQSPSTIVIEPANPEVVYVPAYNPAVIYGTPYVVPNYTAGDVAAASVLSFGAGVAIGELASSSWHSWNVNWYGGAVAYHGAAYYGNAAWHGYGAYGYHGYGTAGAYATARGGYGTTSSYHGAYGSAGAYHGYGPDGAYHTGGAVTTPYGSATSHTSYGPDGGVHTGGSGYNATTGQGYHYGGGETAAGGTVAHGSTASGQHYAGGTTASGQHWSSSGWGHDDWSSRAASDRGWGSMHAGGFSGFHGRR
ncbi:MAG TPA: DUF3300 domain-containing protein [Candidatus Angelobacter sp.]|nr:DUF3300 domain-containing protein [Candidatus Angelobacter sp.]